MDLPGEVHLRHLVGRVAVVEPLWTLAVNLAHKHVADAPLPQRQRLLNLGHQGNILCAVVKGDGSRRERSEDVDDDGCAGGFPGVPDQTAHAYFHVVSSLCHLLVGCCRTDAKRLNPLVPSGNEPPRVLRRLIRLSHAAITGLENRGESDPRRRQYAGDSRRATDGRRRYDLIRVFPP